MVQFLSLAAFFCLVSPAVAGLDDSAALVQQFPFFGREKKAKSKALTQEQTDKLDKMCSYSPAVCKPPFNCMMVANYTEQHRLGETVMIAADGRTNPRAWCGRPRFWKSILEECLVEKDLLKSAKTRFNETMSGFHGEWNAQRDASYCFAEGHCTNEGIALDISNQEVRKQCDKRFGHEAWTVGMSGKAIHELDVEPLSEEGVLDTHKTEMMTKAACALGHYHCDVIYCRETYCKKKQYKEKFGHLQPATPGHLIEVK